LIVRLFMSRYLGFLTSKTDTKGKNILPTYLLKAVPFILKAKRHPLNCFQLHFSFSHFTRKFNLLNKNGNQGQKIMVILKTTMI
jgi:hypothetical protein